MRRTSVLVALLALVGTALTRGGQAALTPRSTLASASPAVGTCYRMSTKELGQASYGEAAVDCLAKHTSQVIGVTYLPGGLSWRKASIARLAKVALKDCYPTITAALGGTVELRAQSAYRLAYFVPSKAQRKAGARWIRCDLILGVGPLAALPPSYALTDPPGRQRRRLPRRPRERPGLHEEARLPHHRCGRRRSEALPVRPCVHLDRRPQVPGGVRQEDRLPDLAEQDGLEAGRAGHHLLQALVEVGQPRQADSSAEVGVRADPRVHGDRGGGRGVDRAGRAELRDRQRPVAHRARGVGEARPLLAEEQADVLGQRRGLEVRAARQVVDAEQSHRSASARGGTSPGRRASHGAGHAGSGRSPSRRDGSSGGCRRCAPRRRGTRWRCARSCRC